MTVHFYDVGQALAALVDLPDGSRIVVDTGEAPRRSRCGGARCDARGLVSKLWADVRLAPISLVWVTHQHADHIGGAPDVLAAFRVGAYADNGRDERKPEVLRAHRVAHDRGVVAYVVDPAHSDVPLADSPGVHLRAIVPPVWPASCAIDPNECSIGLRIDFCASSVLFTGDAEHGEEKTIDPGGPVTLLQVAHHGSETSTTPAFLAKAKPKYAVISAGSPNEGTNRDYCHPRAIIVERLTRLLPGPRSKSIRAFDGARCDHASPDDWVDVASSDNLWATERDGDVVLTTTGDGTFVRRPSRGPGR
jgi:competence protein ComEC